MTKTKVVPKFSIGDNLRVRSGVSDPDHDELTIGGLSGTVSEAENGSPTTYSVNGNGETLRSQSSIYRKRCERDGFDGEAMWLGEDDLEPETGGPFKIEQPSHIVTKPLSMDDQDDRIRAVFGLTSDDPLPDVDIDSLREYHKRLSVSRGADIEPAIGAFAVPPFRVIGSHSFFHKPYRSKAIGPVPKRMLLI